jgi:hypothetical protein
MMSLIVFCRLCSGPGWDSGTTPADWTDDEAFEDHKPKRGGGFNDRERSISEGGWDGDFEDRKPSRRGGFNNPERRWDGEESGFRGASRRYRDDGGYNDRGWGRSPRSNVDIDIDEDGDEFGGHRTRGGEDRGGFGQRRGTGRFDGGGGGRFDRGDGFRGQGGRGRFPDALDELGSNLSAPEWQTMELDQMTKGFYKESESVSALSQEEIQAFYAQHDISVEGKNVIKPIQTFQDAGLPGRCIFILTAQYFMYQQDSQILYYQNTVSVDKIFNSFLHD